MFLDFNEYGVIGTMVLENLKTSGRLFSEYSEWAQYHDDMLLSFDATILSSASQAGKMRNSFLINRYQAMITQPGLEDKKPGALDGLFNMFGKKSNEQQNNGFQMGKT